MIGKNCIQIFFQHTVTLIYTTTKLVSFLISSYGPHDRIKFKKTSCNQAWNIYLDTTCFILILIFILLIYLFRYLLNSISLYCFYLVIIVSCFYPVSRYIFCAWLHEVIPNSNLYWRPTEEVMHKTSLEVTHTVYNYVSKENSHEALPKSSCCSVITLSYFNK